MERRIRFLDGYEEKVLPITPKSFQIEDGVRMETVNLTGLGDIVIPGFSTLTTITISSFFPNGAYSFSPSSEEPYGYVAWFSEKSEKKRVLRVLIDGTGVNLPVVVESIRYGEQDGTNDVYYTLSLQRYRFTSADGSAVRHEGVNPDVEEYTVRDGDTLSIIVNRKYGNAWWYTKIMTYNGKISDIILPGEVLLLPSEEILSTMG